MSGVAGAAIRELSDRDFNQCDAGTRRARDQSTADPAKMTSRGLNKADGPRTSPAPPCVTTWSAVPARGHSHLLELELGMEE